MSAADEDGFTLVELLTVMGMLVVILGATLPMLLATTNQGGRQADRITSLDHDRTAFDAMTRELRQANCVAVLVPGRSIATVTPSTTVGPTTGSCTAGNAVQRVRFDCSVAGARAGTYACVRTDLTTGAQRNLIDGITNTDPLTVSSVSAGGRAIVSGPAPASRSVRVKLEKTPPDVERPVRLDGLVSLRAVGST
jgi:Tfp pilus assembly protein PilW